MSCNATRWPGWRGRAAASGRGRSRGLLNRPERPAELGRARKTHARVLGQGAQDDALELGRNREVSEALAGAGHRPVEVLHHDLEAIVARERQRAGEHVMDQHADRIEIRGLGRRAARYHLRRHILRRARHAMALAPYRRAMNAVAEQARDAEIDELDLVAVDHDVRALQIRVHHTGCVRGLDRVQDLDGQIESLLDRQGAGFVQQAGERAAGHVLHHEIQEPVLGLPMVQGRHYIAMTHAAGRKHLGVELPCHILVVQSGLGAAGQSGLRAAERPDHLDGHALIRPDLLGAIHPAKSALADELAHKIAAIDAAPFQPGSVRRVRPRASNHHLVAEQRALVVIIREALRSQGTHRCGYL
jgi:hypothetical protein